MKESDRARIHAAVDALIDACHGSPEAPAQSTVISGWSQAPLVDKRELARLLSVSSATIDRQVRSGMPYQPVGEVRRFDFDMCKAWLASQGKSTAAPPALSPTSKLEARDGPSGVRLLSHAARRGGR